MDIKEGGGGSGNFGHGGRPGAVGGSGEGGGNGSSGMVGQHLTNGASHLDTGNIMGAHREISIALKQMQSEKPNDTKILTLKKAEISLDKGAENFLNDKKEEAKNHMMDAILYLKKASKESDKGEQVKSFSTVIEQEFFSPEIKIEEQDATVREQKKELVVTLMREGAGNKYHNNYYTRDALETLRKQVETRKKQYFNHAKNIDDPERDLRDWASSITEAWMDTSEPKAKLKARVKVYDNWLWERAKVAPDELAVSVEGKGRGKKETIEGTEYNAIYEIAQANGVMWVDYPGNAGMGVQVLEWDKSEVKVENKMELKDLLEKLTAEDLAKIRETRSDLKEFFLFPGMGDNGETKKELGVLKETVAGLTTKVTILETEKATLANKVEAHEIKEKALAKERLVEKLLSESKLKPEHITANFKSNLLTLEKEEAMKEMIADRESIVVTEKAKAGQEGDGTDATKVKEEDKVSGFCLNILNYKVTPAEEKK